MIQPRYDQMYKTVNLKPCGMQFVINNLPLSVICCACVGYGGMEGLPLTVAAQSMSFCLCLILCYKYIYLRRIRYEITAEQLVCERGILLRKVDYMELYRIVDFQEKQSILQQICGLKTVSILSMDRNTPRLDLLGMKRSDRIVTLIRERVEYNKRKKGIYEITNH